MIIQDTIRLWREEKKAIILAHYYTKPEVQDIADKVGDSLALARYARDTTARVILFAGVHFMAETAKILNPEKKVLVPDLQAGCSLADSCPVDAFARFIKQHPRHKVISYINCSAEVKALSDIIVTSGNALQIVQSLPQEQPIIFAPDRNLGAYINHVTGRQMLLWDGACHVHDQLTAEQVFALKQEYPKAMVIAHPECQGSVLALANFIGSTAAMLNFVKNNPHEEYIVATETGILHEFQKQNPTKQFHVVNNAKSCQCNDCEYMKLNTLEKILNALKNEQPEILLTPDLIRQAAIPLNRMLKN
ncbi:MAG: quinolinate synthase NadA [Bacteroidales bacterium]|jgi:quinolinate synthase|nr:quinolinate synthase NadA [Bacteroidales bacterium]